MTTFNGNSAAENGPTLTSITSTAPCRVDLAGATLDLWPLYLYHHGAVTVNFAVNILTTCRLTPLAGKEIHLKSTDTGREETFASLAEVRAAKTYRHALA